MAWWTASKCFLQINESAIAELTLIDIGSNGLYEVHQSVSTGIATSETELLTIHKLKRFKVAAESLVHLCFKTVTNIRREWNRSVFDANVG